MAAGRSPAPFAMLSSLREKDWMKSDALTNLTEVIRQGLPEPEGGVRSSLAALFHGGRYHKNH